MEVYDKILFRKKINETTLWTPSNAHLHNSTVAIIKDVIVWNIDVFVPLPPLNKRVVLHIPDLLALIKASLCRRDGPFALSYYRARYLLVLRMWQSGRLIIYCNTRRQWNLLLRIISLLRDEKELRRKCIYWNIYRRKIRLCWLKKKKFNFSPWK